MSTMLAESMLAHAESMLADTELDTDPDTDADREPMVTNAETNFIINNPELFNRLKHEAIDRLHSIVSDNPKYKENFETLIINFTIEDMLYLIHSIYRDRAFKRSKYYKVYNKYFDEIEEMTHKYISC